MKYVITKNGSPFLTYSTLQKAEKVVAWLIKGSDPRILYEVRPSRLGYHP